MFPHARCNALKVLMPTFIEKTSRKTRKRNKNEEEQTIVCFISNEKRRTSNGAICNENEAIQWSHNNERHDSVGPRTILETALQSNKSTRRCRRGDKRNERERERE